MNIIMETIKSIIEVFNALLSPIMAIIVTYIAYQQWQSNKEKNTREKNEEIISIYLRVKEFLNFVDQNRLIHKELYKVFTKALSEADFICSKKLVDWLDKVDGEVCSYYDNVKIHENIMLKNEDFGEIANLEYEIESNIDKLQDAHCELLKMFKEEIKK